MSRPSSAAGANAGSPVNGWPDEIRLNKKLALRLARVQLLLATVDALDGYAATHPTESVDALRAVLDQVIDNGRLITHCGRAFNEAAQWRQRCYGQGTDSLKETATVCWLGFSAVYPALTLPHQVVRVIWDRLRNQSALSASAHLLDPAKPNGLRTYRQSYSLLAESFQLLLTVTAAIGFVSTRPALQADQLGALWDRIRRADGQAEETVARLKAARQEQARLYEDLRERTAAVVERVGQQVGRQHPSFRRIRYCKL